MKNFNLIEMAKAMKEHKLRHMWRYAAMMALLLMLVCGNVWGAEYTLINQSTGAINNTDFCVNVSASSTAYTVEETPFSKCISLGGAPTTPVGAYPENKIIRYDVKTNDVTITVYAYNKATSKYSVYVSMLEEGATTAVVRETSWTGKSGKVITERFTPTKNASIYVHVGNNTNLVICQVSASENGSNLPSVASNGYSIRLDSCRATTTAGETEYLIDGALKIKNANNGARIWNKSYPIKLKSTSDYISFITTSTMIVSIKASGTYSVTKSNTYQSGSAISGNQEVELTSGTWYICPNGSNTSFTTLSFASAAPEPECEDVDAPTSLSCTAQTQTSLTYTWSKASHASTYTAKLYSDSGCESEVKSSDLGDVATVTFSDLTAGTTYYCRVQSHGDGSTYCAGGGTTSAASGTTSACTAISPTWSYPFSTVAVGITIYPTIGGNTGGGAVTYSSSATSKITNDCYATAAGSATLTANVAANGVYCSGSVTSGTITVVSDQSGLIKQSLNYGNSTAWGTPSAPATSGTYASDITSTTAIAAYGTDYTIATTSNDGNNSNDGQTGKVPSLGSYDASKYVAISFTVASGKKLNVSAIYIPVQPVSKDYNNFKAVLTDDDDETDDIVGTISNIPNGKLAYIPFSSYGSVTGNVTLKIYAWGNDGKGNNWTAGYRFGKSIVIDGEIEDAPSSCTAADHVDISGEWAAFIGYPISLTATAYDDEDNAIETGLSYQWYKDGTADGNMIDGATSATYYKASAELSDYGSYYCKVSKAGCSDVFSSAYGIKIMRIHLMWEDGTEVSDYAFHNFAPIGDSKAVCTIALEGYHYSLQVLDGQYGWGDNNNAWFSRSNYWGTTASPWTHGTVDNKTFIDCDIAGDYVFTLDYSSGYKMGVMYPQPTYYYKGNDDAWSSTHEMTKSCDGTYAYFWTKGATSLQAAGRGTNNNNFLIMNAAGNNTIADGNKLEIRDGEATGFGGTDIWGSSNMGKWDGSTNASIYNAGDFYIVVFYPNNSINTTNNPKICASTKLPGNATTADEVVYFEKPASNWGDKAYYRIGHRGTSSAPEMELVPGTARLYQHVLSEWTGYEAWCIANNSSWQGSNNSIYKVDTGDEYDITKSTNYFKCETDGNITIILDDENYTADGCTFYNVNTYSGMLTHTATVSDMTNGSVRLNWTDVNDAAQSATSTTSNLAHTCNLQITGVPATGYDVATLTVNGSNFTSGDTHVLSADATIAATFALHNYNVTYSAPSNGNYTIKVADGTASSASKTATYGQTITIVATPSTGYSFSGWTISKAGGGTVTPVDASATTTTFSMPADDVTITASFAINTYTVSFAASPAGYGSVSPTSIASVNHGSTVSIASNVLTLKATNVTATPTSAGADYTYSFSSWSVSNGASITEAQTITANFTRTAKQYSVTHSLTGVTTSSGATGANAATYGTNYTAVFAASSGYALPNSVTVTAGGSDITANCTYTKGTGTVSIPGSYITGNIVITVTGVEEVVCPSSASGETVYKFVTKSSDLGKGNVCAAASTEYPQTTSNSLSTLTGGTLKAYGTGSLGQLTFNEDCYKLAGSDNTWLIVELDCAIATGDVIRYVNYASSGNTVMIETTRGTSTSIVMDGNGTMMEQTIVAPAALNGVKTLYLTRKAGTAFLTSFEILRPYTVTLNASTNGGNVGGNNTATMYFKDSESQALPHAFKSSNYFTGWFEDDDSGDAVDNPYTATGTGTLYAQFDACASQTGSLYKFEVKNTLTAGSPFTTGTDGNASMTVGNYLSSLYGGTLDVHGRNTYLTNTTSAFTLTNNSAYLLVTLDCPLQAGDQIKSIVSNNSVAITTSSSRSTTNTLATGTNTITIPDGFAGKTTLYIWRNSANGDISYLEIIRPNGVTITGAVSPDGYGTVSPASIFVASGSTVSLASNVLTCDGKTLTATPTVATAEYTYAFSSWSGVTNGGTVSVATTATANFTRTANNYTLAWSSNGGSELSGDYTSGSTAYGASITAPTDPTLSNYTFDGWKTNNDGTGTTAGSTMPAATTTYYAAWKQTVTLTTGAQGSGGNQTPYVYLNGTGVSSFTAHTASGYSLQGYYTAGSGGVKVLNADGTFAAANVTDYITSSKWSRTGAAPTLFAQWVASEDCRTLKYVWKVTGNFCDDQSTATSAVSMISENDYFTLSGTGYKQESGKSLNLQNTQNNYFLLTAKTGYQIKSICFYGKVQDSSVDYTTDGSSWSALASTKTDGDKYYTFDDIDASAFGIKLTAATPEGVWIRNMVIEVCAEGGTTYNVTYDGNDNTSGDAPTDATNYSYGDAVTVLGNTGSLEKTNYTFAGWTTNDDGTGSSYVADNTFSITANTTLYAKWTQTVTFDANTANHGSTGGSATAVWNATGLTGITHATPASGYKLLGYYTAPTSGTKVLNSDGSFADDNITDWIDDGKWVQNDDDEPLLYAQYEASGSIKWNLQVNSADAPIVTSSKNSSYTQISTSNMTNLDSIGLKITASKKASMTSKISAPTAFDKDKYMKVTFQVASGYQFKPSSIKVPIQPVDGGADVKLVLVDNAATPDSIGKVQSSLSKGTLTTVEMTNSSAVFKGTVTLKIYCYGSSTGTYRLGTPIQIDGEIESTCTMPSYGSVSYSQTEYTVGDTPSSISVEDATGDPTYQWKYNSTGDRSSGTNGVTTASMSPSTASAGTTYYWCELTNACGTVKTPAVAITVSESKSEAPSIAWTDPASTPNYGGGGYTIRATVNDASWDGSASDLTITAPAGIRIYNTTTGTDGSSKKYIEVKFDVQTAFDRETYSSNIPFTVSADATTSYNAISADHNVSYSACSGGGGSATEELMAVDASHIDNSTWKGGWVYDGIGMMRYGHGSSDISAGTKDANLKDLSYTMASGDITKYYKSASNHFGFYTEKAITGIRLYVYTSNDNVTVSNVYVANSAYTSGTPSSGAVSFEAEYNDGNDALRTGTHSGSAWVDITFASEVAAEKYGQINLSNNVNIAGMAFISASGSGASLTTTLSFASSSVTKAQSDANFTITPTKGDYSETLGAITYSSSNTDCATVNATTGEVTITASGASDQSTTITATLAASGCYKGATTTYTITVAGVSCTVNHGTLASDVTTKCSTADATLTLTGFDSGATVQWYKGESTIGNGATYAITTEGTTSTMVTKEVGTYSVMVTKDECSDRSNSITISNYSAEVAATKIVDKWYIKNGRVTPDIALWALDEGTHLSSVAWSPSNATGLTAADDFYESDGIVYLKGTEPSSNESSDVEYTLTLTVKDECENTTALSTSDKQITLTHQKNTDKHVLAFVVTGTEKGGWTAGISADQTTNVELYNEIAKNFDVQATNIYSTDDEQKLKEYYSQFDILCITDYPNTKTTGTNKKSYVDAIGSLIDIRPILTMEAWVSGLANWKSKGISGTPKSPTTRQYSMLLQCKDHEIFSGTNPTTVGSGDETMYRIDMVDKTQEEYVTLDATYGAGAHESDKNYQYGKKPALQGFTYDASMSSLLPIGRIDDGEGNDLEVGVERQAVMEARLLVLGINGYAMERLDDDGQTIVINALKYLMKKNAEDISDCSNYFVGGAEGDETNWFNLENWSGSTLPDRTQEVRIVAPCEISGDVARAASVKIVTGGKYNRGTQTARGQLTIESNGSLIVEGKIYAAEAPNFFEQRTTEPEDLVVKADDSYTGTLIFDNEDGETQATIEMYSPSHWEVVAGKYVKYWSYVGMPIKDVHIPDYFYGAFTYYFNEAKGWEKRFDNDIMQPFEGIGLSMQSGHKETFYGTMVSTENTDITITNHTGYGDGDNLIGNSWTAPIQIANFDAEDFGSCWATVYIFNTGKGGNTYVNATAGNDGAAKAGQWLGIPIGVAGLPEYTGLKVIPAMNAFLVHDTLSTSTTLHLDYDKLVRDDATTNTQINEKMRAPSRHPRKKKDVDGLMRIRVVGEKTNTDVWMLQDARFSEGFDNGWEARYNPCDDRSAQLYARSKAGVMSFIALPDLDGTVLGFAPSRDGNDYTFTFQYRGEDEYYLNDLKLQQSVLIDADNNYAFTYEKGDTNRFYVSRTPLAPQTPTGVDNASGATQSTKAIKVIYNGKLYIIRSGRVYSAEGILVK